MASSLGTPDGLGTPVAKKRPYWVVGKNTLIVQTGYSIDSSASAGGFTKRGSVCQQGGVTMQTLRLRGRDGIRGHGGFPKTLQTARH